MKRVCHILDILEVGGIELTLLNLVSPLARDCYQEVWCLKQEGTLAPEFRRQGIAVRAFVCPRQLHIPSLVRLRQALIAGKFDIVHAHGMYPSIWARAAAILAGIPCCIVHCQNLYVDIPLHTKLKMWFLIPFTRRFIAVSRAVKQSMIVVGIPERLVTVIPNGCPALTAAAESIERVRALYHIREDDFVIVSTGRIVQHKGHTVLADAILRLKADMRIKCLIVGEGEYLPNLKKHIEELGCQDQVILCGLHRDISAFLGVATVFVQPSAWIEGMPLSLVEAASQGLPLVATDVGGNGELVRDGENGFLTPPRRADIMAEKLRYLYRHPAQRLAFGERSRDIWKDNFTVERMAAGVLAVYQEAGARQ